MSDVATQGVVATGRKVDLAFGGYRACIGDTPQLVRDALHLRAESFRNGQCDRDAFDLMSCHGVVYGPDGRALLGFRLRHVSSKDLAATYSGQFYDLSPLANGADRFVEIGRFCHESQALDTTAVRLAWAAIAVVVDESSADMLIGCSSFPGTDPDVHAPVLATLRRNHLGPTHRRPHQTSALACPLPTNPAKDAPLPPLLRAYLSLGGWVGDHVVKDPELQTLHVFTGLDICAIPEHRKTRLRALARAAQSDPRSGS